MIYLKSFLFVGTICLIGQIILDNTKLTAGHITSLFVVFGAFLDTFSIYDKIIKIVGPGAYVPITSFGHSLVHGALKRASDEGFIGIFTGMFDFAAAGLISAIFFSFVFALIFKPKD
jgi:stage V sporulation protein AE